MKRSILTTLAAVTVFAAIPVASAQAAGTVTPGASTKVSTDSAVSAATLTKPSGVVAGDALVAEITADSNPTISTPAGWKLIASQPIGSGATQAAFVHVVGTTAEPASYSFPFSKVAKYGGGIASFHNVDPTTPLDSGVSKKVDATFTAKSLQVPGVTTVTPGSMVVLGAGADRASAGFVPPAGVTEAFETSTTGQASALSYVGLTGTGPTGDVWQDMTDGSAAGAFLVALRPGAGTTTPPPTTDPTPPPTTDPTPPPTTGTVTSPAAPAGVSGYTKKWADEFNTLDTAQWYVADSTSSQVITNNGVQSKASNVRVSGGVLQTALGDTDGVKDSSGKLQPETGAHLYTKVQMLDVGEVAEFRAKFHTTTDGTGKYRSWTAVWVSGNPWPAAGEVDTFEVLGGDATTNYHYLANGAHATDPSGPQSFAAGKDQWATYSVERTATQYIVRWNGAVIHTFADKDGTTPQNLLITAGNGSGDLFGFANTPLEVDYAAIYGK